ncbi:MAG TPA: universal stress protein, partial [Ktedonobacteraceae bacterium]|nr:universal stress protein [Ktedonobacteraceae bacterium]
ERAIPVAARLARASNGSVILLQVVTPPIDYGGYLAQAPLLSESMIETYLDEAKSYLENLAKSKDLAGIGTRVEAIFGTPAQEIFALTQSRRVDLIVMTSHGRTGFTRWALGSVAHRVVHHSPVPVLVLRDDAPLPVDRPIDADHPLRALVPLDGSPLAETALEPAAYLIAALASPSINSLHLAQVVKLPSTTHDEEFVAKVGKEILDNAKTYLAAVKDRLDETLKERKLSITWSVAIESDVADALIGMAEHVAEGKEAKGLHDCDLIAMSTHGRGGWERWTMGSVTERVLNGARLPVLVVRPQKVKAEQEVSEDEMLTENLKA